MAVRIKKHLEGGLWLTSFGSLLLAAQTSARTTLMLIAVLWAAATVMVVPLHFYRAWSRVASVPNKSEYAVWVGIETLFTLGLVVGCVYMVCSR